MAKVLQLTMPKQVSLRVHFDRAGRSRVKFNDSLVFFQLELELFCMFLLAHGGSTSVLVIRWGCSTSQRPSGVAARCVCLVLIFASL